jgi:hypothetical protein
MPVSVELILIGAALLLIGLVRLKGKKWGWFDRPKTTAIAPVGSGKPRAARFDWKGLSMALVGGVALALGLALEGIDLLNALFTWLKS